MYSKSDFLFSERIALNAMGLNYSCCGAFAQKIQNHFYGRNRKKFCIPAQGGIQIRKNQWMEDGTEEYPVSTERNPSRQELTERYRKYYRRICRLRIMDDDFMRKILGDPACIQLVLRIIMEKPDLIVKEVKVQFDMKNLQGRSLELDVLAVDGEGRLYDIEVQRDEKKATPHRARYHSVLIDANSLEPGEDFCNLPQNYVIFITEKDVLGDNLPIYHVERRIRETGRLFGDDTHILYVNAKIQDDTELGKLMHDFMCPDPREMNYKVLSDRARYFKETEKGVANMCTVFEEVKEEGREEGLEEGRQEGRRSACRELLRILREYGDIPLRWKQQIEREQDLLKLFQWYRLAVQTQNVEEFGRALAEEKMGSE